MLAMLPLWWKMCPPVEKGSVQHMKCVYIKYNMIREECNLFVCV